MRFYHIVRNRSVTLAAQKKELKARYKNFQYVGTWGGKIHFMADEI